MTNPNLRSLIGAVALLVGVFNLSAGPGAAADDRVDILFERLLTADPAAAIKIEREILRLWSDSGSPALNLLLERGRRAMRRRNHRAAIEHLTALTDHAPEFAEGWNARATAWYLMGEHEMSLADIARTLSLNDRHFGAMSGLAMIMEHHGDHMAALEIYREIEKIYPRRIGLAEKIAQLMEKIAERSI